jgi:HAD superfamily hydrolase (TIGR01509 family)
MRSPLRAGVLLDVDGTLVDTNYLHTLAWSRAFRQAGEWAPMNAIHRLVGMGGDHLIPRLLGHQSPEAEEARTACYRDLINDARVFPGAHDLVVALHDRGLATVLATSSPSDELDVLLDLLEIDRFLDTKTTADDIERSKPSPEVFLTAMKNGSLDPARTLAIGDSIWDVEAAQEAGIGCIGVESGGFSRHELSESGALHVYRDVREILDQLLTTPLATLLGTT